MKTFHSILPIALLFLALVASPLFAQQEGPCPYSITAEHLGEGNCYQLTLANNSANDSIALVILTPNTEEAVIAGHSESLFAAPETDKILWNFVQPLTAGSSVTRYFCLASTVADVTLLATWYTTSGAMCADTLALTLPTVQQRCIQLTSVVPNCVTPASISSSSEHFVSIDELRFINRTDFTIRTVTSFDVDGQQGSGSNSTYTPRLAPGDTSVGLSYQYTAFDDQVDERGWFLFNLGITVCDSAETTCCTDTITIMSPACSTSDAPGTANTAALSLGAATPNPAGEYIVIPVHCSTPQTGVRLMILDAQGREALTVLDAATLADGTHAISVPTAALASGHYFYTLTTGNHTETRQFVIQK